MSHLTPDCSYFVVSFHRAIRLRLPVEQSKISKTNIALPLSNRCHETDDRESELEVPLRNLILLSRLLTVARKPYQPGGAPPRSCMASNQSRTRSSWDRSTQLGQLLNDTEGKQALLTQGDKQLTHLALNEPGGAPVAAGEPSPLGRRRTRGFLYMRASASSRAMTR